MRYHRRGNTPGVKRSLACLAAVGIGFAIAAGCGGGGGQRGGDYVGRLTSVVSWKLNDATYAGLDGPARAKLTQKGITVDDATKTLRSAELGLAGHWVKVGDRTCMTDREGNFTVEGGAPSAGNADVFAQLDHETPEGAFPLDKLVEKGQTPIPVRLELSYSPPAGMNDDPDAAGTSRSRVVTTPGGCELHEPCEPIGSPNSNKKPCCLDYDGNVGDGLPRQREKPGHQVSDTCNALAYTNFINSTCFEWTFQKKGRPCSSEVIPYQVGPSCWVRHGFRNCQNMDENDFHATESVNVPLGSTRTFKIRNNTEANFTVLRFKEDGAFGVIGLAPGAPSARAELLPWPGGQRLGHFSREDTVHFEEVILSYTAPESLPDGRRTATLHVIVEGGGYTREVELKIGGGERAEITPTNPSLKVGATLQMSAVIKDADDEPVPAEVTWTSSSAAISISPTGFVTGVAKGQSVVTAHFSTYPDLQASTAVTVTEEEPLPGATYPLRTVNGKSVPTAFLLFTEDVVEVAIGGQIVLRDDKTFDYIYDARTDSPFGQGAVRRLSGKGTYVVSGGAITFHGTSGINPGKVTIQAGGSLTRTYIIPKDPPFVDADFPVTEVWRK
jgi:hypothetical protein